MYYKNVFYNNNASQAGRPTPMSLPLTSLQRWHETTPITLLDDIDSDLKPDLVNHLIELGRCDDPAFPKR